MTTLFIYLGYAIFKTISAIYYAVIVLPFFYFKSKLFRMKRIKKEMFSAIKTLYKLDFNEKDYQYDINVAPGFTISEVKSPSFFDFIAHKDNRVRFATTQLSDQDLWFKINVDNVSNPIDFPVVFDIDKALKSLSHIFNIEHLLYMRFQSGMLETVKIELIMLSKNKGVYIERDDHPPIRIDIGINIKIKKNIEIDYEAQLMRLNYISSYRNALPLNELFQMIKLESIDNLDVIKQITEILPELKIPSAYDFTSDDFKQRLLLVEMFQY